MALPVFYSSSVWQEIPSSINMLLPIQSSRTYLYPDIIGLNHAFLCSHFSFEIKNRHVNSLLAASKVFTNTTDLIAPCSAFKALVYSMCETWSHLITTVAVFWQICMSSSQPFPQYYVGQIKVVSVGQHKAITHDSIVISPSVFFHFSKCIKVPGHGHSKKKKEIMNCLIWDNGIAWFFSNLFSNLSNWMFVC